MAVDCRCDDNQAFAIGFRFREGYPDTSLIGFVEGIECAKRISGARVKQAHGWLGAGAGAADQQ